MADDADHNRRYERGQQIFELLEDAQQTPSALDGIPADVERAERIAGAFRAKAIVTTVLTGAKGPDGYTDLCKGNDISDTEALACYYLHLFFMHRSLREQPAKTVAAAAAFLACKVMDFNRRIKDILRANNQHRILEGEAELGEEEQEAFRKKVVKLELLLLRMIKYDFDIEIMAPNMKEISEQILTMICISYDFLKKHGASDIAQAVDELQPKIMHMSFNFLKDAFLGYGPLMMKPKELAASAVAVSLRSVRRELPIPGLLHLAKMAMESYQVTVKEDKLNAGVKEIVNAVKSKNQYAAKLADRRGSGRQAGVSAGAPPSRPAAATPGSSKAGMPPPSLVPTKALQSKAAAEASGAAPAAASVPETRPLVAPGGGGSSSSFSAAVPPEKPHAPLPASVQGKVPTRPSMLKRVPAQDLQERANEGPVPKRRKA